MTYARKTLVSLNDTPYYHVVARCVRRAWLWGFDEYAGRDYSHRKQWVLERLAQLTSIFTIELRVCRIVEPLSSRGVRGSGEIAGVQQGAGRRALDPALRAPPVVERWSNGKATQAERQLADYAIVASV